MCIRDRPTVALLVVALARLLGALMWNIRAVGVEYIPTEGPVVFASNHMSIADAHAIAFFVKMCIRDRLNSESLVNRLIARNKKGRPKAAAAFGTKLSGSPEPSQWLSLIHI